MTSNRSRALNETSRPCQRNSCPICQVIKSSGNAEGGTVHAGPSGQLRKATWHQLCRGSRIILASLTGLRTPSPMKAVKRQAGTLGGQRFFPQQYRFLLGTPSPVCPRAQQSTSGHTTELGQSTLLLRNLRPAYLPSFCLLANPRAHRGLCHLL